MFSEIQPQRRSVELMTPDVGAKICSTMPPMMTHERKCGRYSIVCENFLSLGVRISLSRMARIIGTGKPKSKSSPFRISVFFSAMPKSLMPKTNLKLSSPIHLLLAGLNMLYFWKAI